MVIPDLTQLPLWTDIDRLTSLQIEVITGVIEYTGNERKLCDGSQRLQATLAQAVHARVHG